jgi:hypothetical protein
MSPADVALRFVDRINAGDHEGLSRLMTEDFRFTDYGGAEYQGRDLMRGGFRRYFEMYPGYRIILDRLLSSGSTSILIIGRAERSHLGPVVEQKKTLAWKADIRDGLVAEWRIYASPEAKEV